MKPRDLSRHDARAFQMNRTMLPLPPALVRGTVPVLAAAWLLLALRALTGFGARSEVVLDLPGGSVT